MYVGIVLYTSGVMVRTADWVLRSNFVASHGTVTSFPSFAASTLSDTTSTVIFSPASNPFAVFTLRQIKEGEELTFDYSSVTESEKEMKTVEPERL